MVDVGAAPGRLVGRRDDLDALHRALRTARAGQPATVLLSGDPGAGKSALLRSFLDTVDDVEVLEASADELEAATTYGVVEQLLRIVPRDHEFPPLLHATTLPDPQTVGLHLAALLSAIATERTAVVSIDDAQWADTSSLQATAVALRRLRDQPVLALVAVHSEGVHRLPPGLLNLAHGPWGVRLSIAGLTAEDLVELARLVRGSPISTAAARRLHRHTGGNPLHACALLEELSTEELETGARDTPLPVPRSFASLVALRLSDCDPDTQRLVAAASVLGTSSPLRLAAELAEVSDAFAAAQSATEANLLVSRRTHDGHVVRFPQALVRAAVYHDLGPGRAAELHAHAAEIVEDEATALRHRAATVDRDAELATDVATFARRAATRGAWAEAAAALEQASRLSPERDDRERHFLDAVECHLLAGDGAAVEELLPQIDEVRDSPRRRYILGRLELVQGGFSTAHRLLEEAWTSFDPADDPGLAARIAGMVATIDLNQGHGYDAVRWARRAHELGREDGSITDARWVLIFALSLRGETEEAVALADEVVHGAVAGALTAGTERAGALTGRGVARLWAGDAIAASGDLRAACELARRTGPFHVGLIALFYLADAEYRIGAWDDSETHADEAVAAATDADQPWFAPLLHAIAAFPRAARGDWEVAASHVDIAREAATTIGHAGAHVWAATAAARIAHARDDHVAVRDVLEPLRSSLGGRSGLFNPDIQPWALLLGEAQVRTGDPGAAADVVESLLCDEQSTSALVGIRRLQGLLAAARGDHDGAQGRFRTAIDLAAITPSPFARALLLLDYGTWLRHRGQRDEARDQLESARAVLESLRAAPYLTRCERELTATGGRPGQRGPHDLTHQERAVADLVVVGATNREAAEELFVSVKAIEYHLSNIYRKLGIRSRSELAARAAELGLGSGDRPGDRP